MSLFIVYVGARDFPYDSSQHYYRQFGDVLVVYKRVNDITHRGQEVARFNGNWAVVKDSAR